MNEYFAFGMLMLGLGFWFGCWSLGSGISEFGAHIREAAHISTLHEKPNESTNEEEEEPDENSLAVGTKVCLKSGSPLMTVSGADSEGRLRCVWLDNNREYRIYAWEEMLVYDQERTQQGK